MYMYVHVSKYGRKKAVLKYFFYVSRPSDDGKMFFFLIWRLHGQSP